METFEFTVLDCLSHWMIFLDGLIFVLLLAPRSGLAVKHFLDVGGKNEIPKFLSYFYFNNHIMINVTMVSHVIFQLVAGVIDSDYRGNVGVVMFNFSEDEYSGK